MSLQLGRRKLVVQGPTGLKWDLRSAAAAAAVLKSRMITMTECREKENRDLKAKEKSRVLEVSFSKIRCCSFAVAGSS